MNSTTLLVIYSGTASGIFSLLHHLYNASKPSYERALTLPSMSSFVSS